MNKRLNLRQPWAAIVCICLAALATARADTTVTKKSRETIDSVLREPLPPEDLSLAERSEESRVGKECSSDVCSSDLSAGSGDRTSRYHCYQKEPRDH